MVTVDQESRTLFDRETKQIHKIQIEFLTVTADKMAVAIKNNVVLSRVVEFTRCGWPSLQRDTYLLPYFQVRNDLTIEDRCLL